MSVLSRPELTLPSHLTKNPDIDPEPTAEERAAAEGLIAAERASAEDDPHHALLPAAYVPTFTAAMEAELARVASTPRKALKAIDLTRYEAQEAPSPGGDDGDKKPALESALRRAYASHAYLASRRAHLALLDAHGKNAWLVGNWQLEAELRAVEAELAAARRDVDRLTVRRQRLQGDAAAELRGLDETWRRGVGRVLETEVAAEQLRRRLLEVRTEQTAAQA